MLDADGQLTLVGGFQAFFLAQECRNMLEMA
jgi:hypothetical protein